MKTTTTTAQITPLNIATNRYQLTDFSPGYNNDRVFWSSKDSGFASYILGPVQVVPGEPWRRFYVFTTSAGQPVNLVSVNGCGEERWMVSSHNLPQGADLEAINYFCLTPDQTILPNS